MPTTLDGQLDLSAATEGTALPSNTDVASFTDDNLADTASSFTATIDWGDGTTTSGTVVGSNGSFTVDGGHTYADEGFPTATVNVTRTADNTQLSMSGTVPVADADNLTGHSAPAITANPNQALTNVTVATFTDTYTGNTAADFTTSIDWGDGTTTTGVLSGSGGNFTVTGSHTYTTAGRFTITTFMNDDTPDAAAGFATTIAGIGFGGNGVPQEVTEGTSSGTVTVATFNDNASLPASNYTATIDWGDGTTTSGVVSGSGGSFSVTGSHTYADEGDFTSNTTITRTTDNAQIQMSGAITVDEGDVLAASGVTIHGDLALSNVTVATFTDLLTTNVAGDFLATIDWGDGTTTAGTVSGTGGSFSVSGSHTYAQGGQYDVLADVRDDAPGVAEDTATSTANVGLYNGAGATLNGTEGTAVSGTTATFTDGDTADAASAFSASIDWGDGTTTTGTVTGSNGSFSVQGTHAYSDEGNFTTTTSVTRTVDNSKLTITGSVAAADADSLILGPTSFTANPGQAFNGQVASFSDTFTGNTASDFAAFINWGDGTFSAGTITGSGALFTVSGSHTYTSGGSFNVTTTVSDDAPGTASATGTGTATVNLAGAMTLTSGTEHVAINNATVATFTDSTAGDQASGFAATINWGDGTSSAGTVSGGPGPGAFTVQGSHTYADEGNDQASVTLTRTADQAQSTVVGSVAVAEHDSLTAQAVAISGTAQHALANVTVATFTDTDTVTPASDFVATIDWGDGTTSAGTIAGANGAFSVNGSHTYAAAGQDTVTVTVSDDAPGTATATATATATITQPPVARPFQWAGSPNLGSHGPGWEVGGVGDFNHDGTSDVLWRNTTTGQVDEWQLANGQWARSVDLGTHSAAYQVAAIGDFNGDGTSDVLWRNPTTGQLEDWIMANGQWSRSVDLGSHGADWQVLGTGDFDGNGTSDILFRNSTTAQVDEWHMQNGNWAGSQPLGIYNPGDPAGWKFAGIGDFNGDGTSDVLWRNPTTGQMDEWQMKNGNWSNSINLGTFNTAYNVAAVNDFNGDGTSDVLWRNPTTGQVEGWVMQDGQWSSSVTLGSFDPAYRVAGTGDFDHSLTADVLWHNPTTGQVSEWLFAHV